MYLMNDLVQKAKMINKRREAHQQMTPEYKLRFNKGFEAKRKKKNASFKKK